MNKDLRFPEGGAENPASAPVEGDRNRMNAETDPAELPARPSILPGGVGAGGRLSPLT